MRSMTGYGSGKAEDGVWQVSAELKTVNHRFLDLGLRLPRDIAFLEQTVRDVLSSGLRRGHADIYITVTRKDASSMEVRADPALARSYAEAAGRIAEAVGTEDGLSLRDLMAMEGVVTLTEREMDRDAVTALCAKALEEAAAQVTGMREREGEHLREDLRIHLDLAAGLRGRIAERAPGVVTDYRARLETRLQQMSAEGVDPQRLAQEVALMADRCAIDEELQRLGSHIAQMRHFLDAEGEIGKKMDFLTQEMNREANTIGSKASDAEITKLVVELKSEIEKLREQVQNVE